MSYKTNDRRYRMHAAMVRRGQATTEQVVALPAGGVVVLHAVTCSPGRPKFAIRRWDQGSGVRAQAG